MPPTARHLVKAFVSSLDAPKGTHPLVRLPASAACTGMCTGKSEVPLAELPRIHRLEVRAKCEHPPTCVRRGGAKRCLEYAQELSSQRVRSNTEPTIKNHIFLPFDVNTSRRPSWETCRQQPDNGKLAKKKYTIYRVPFR